MEKATPVQMRQSLEVVEHLRKAGVRFVAVPVLDEMDFQNLLYHLNTRLEKMATQAELEERQST